MPESYTRTPNVECAVCKKAVYRRPCELEKTAGRAFCNQTCYGISCRNEKPCLICKKPILASFNRKTCSRACSNKHRQGIQYGIGSPKDKVKTTQALKSRLVAVRGTQCERCGYKRADILQVHHKNRDRGNNELENLELICPNCHCEEHYGEK